MRLSSVSAAVLLGIGVGLSAATTGADLPPGFVAPGVKILPRDAVVESDWQNDHCTTIIAGKDVCGHF